MLKYNSLTTLLNAEGKEKTVLAKNENKIECTGSLKEDVKRLDSKGLRQLKSMKFSAEAQKELDSVYKEIKGKIAEKKTIGSKTFTQERDRRY